MKFKKNQWHQYYGKYLSKISDLPSVVGQRTSRVNSIDRLFAQARKNSEEIQLTPQKTLRKMSTKKLEPLFKDEVNDPLQSKRRSISMTIKKFIKKPYQEDQVSIQEQKDQLIKAMAENIDSKIEKQGMQLKELELHRKHVNTILNNLVNTQLFKQIKDLKYVHEKDLNPSKKTLKISKEKKDTIYDPQKYKDLYHKIGPDPDIHLPQGPLLSFRQFARQQGMRMPKFLE